MKKFYSIIALMLLFLGNAWADNIIADDKTFTVGSQCVTSLDDISTGYYAILANPADNPSYLYENTSNHSVAYTTGVYSSGISGKNYIFKITVDDDYSSTRNLTIQAYDGYYLNSTFSLNETTPTTYTASKQGTGNIKSTSTSVTRFFFQYNNKANYLNAINNSTGSGGWGQYALYPVAIQEPTEEEFTIKTYNAPTGTKYKIGDTDLEITVSDGIGTGTFSDLASKVTNSYVTVTPPTGYDAFATVSGTTYSIFFAPTVIGTTKYYSSNKSATEIVVGQWYLLYQSRNPGYAYNNSGTYYMGQQSNFSNGTEVTSSNYVYLFQFYPTGEENQYYIMSADGKFFGSAAQSSTAISASNTQTAYNVVSTGHSDGCYFYMQDANSNIIIDNNGSFSTVVGYGTSVPTGNNDSGHNNVWRFFPVSDTQITHTVNWNISYTDGSETKTKTVTQSVIDGEDATLPSYAYTTVNTTDTYTNITDDKEISATATFSNLPFTSSTDYENAKWYYFKAIRTTGNNAGTYYAYYDASATTENIKINKNSNSNTKNYKWAFIGNPIEGYMVINKNGENLYAYAANGANNTMLSVNSTETTWNIVNASAQAENSFCFYLKGTTGGYWNCYNSSSKIGMWQEGSTDEGSRWFVEEAPENDEADIAAYTAALDKANAYIFGTGLSEYSGDGSAIVSARTNYSGLTVNNTQEEVDDATAAINEAITNSISNLTLNMPTRNSSFVKIKSYASGRNVAPGTSSTSGTSTTVAGTTAITTIETAATDGSDIWFYGTDGLISYTAGTYLANRGATIEAQTAEISANTNYIGTYFVQTAGIYDFNKSGNGQYPGLDRGNSQSSDEGYAWKLEAVTSLPVTAHQSGDGKYYATACVPVAVTVDGATAYKVTTANNNDTIAGVAVLEEIGTTVPANTPMLLIGTQENVTLNITESDATAPIDNILTGARTATEVVDGNYYFGQNDNVPGFYKVNYDNTGSTRIYITNRAYLTTVGDATTSQAKGFTFVFGDDDPTGIGSATASDEILQNSVRYNLQGQRVDESYKGIVIIGGKKYLIK